MRAIERSTRFKRNYKRETKGKYRATLDADLVSVLKALATDQLLAPRQHDHDLSGQWVGCRECHIKPDLLLIYRKPDPATLQLVRLGSHSELFV